MVYKMKKKDTLKEKKEDILFFNGKRKMQWDIAEKINKHEKEVNDFMFNDSIANDILLLVLLVLSMFFSFKFDKFLFLFVCGLTVCTAIQKILKYKKLE